MVFNILVNLYQTNIGACLFSIDAQTMYPLCCDVKVELHKWKVPSSICRSRELSTCIPPPLRHSRRGELSEHHFCMDIGNSRLVTCGAYFLLSPLIYGTLFHLLRFMQNVNLNFFKASVFAHQKNVL